MLSALAQGGFVRFLKRLCEVWQISQGIVKFPGLSPNDITPGEATPRRVVAQLPVPVGVATRRHFPAWQLQRQGHLARFFRLLVRATCTIPILPAPDALRGSKIPRTWLKIPCTWLINPLHVAQNPPLDRAVRRAWGHTFALLKGLAAFLRLGALLRLYRFVSRPL